MNRRVPGNALPEGHLLHWYRIGHVLGQGGFGITYLASDMNLDRQVAIKEYLPITLAVREEGVSVRPYSADRTEVYLWGRERFLAEAKTLARFVHPNIVRVHAVFEANNTAYMVMEYEQGECLEDLLKFDRLGGEEELLDLTRALLEGLGHVHESGFIHRDIKPSNILVRRDGSPVLLDFGSARFALGDETRALTTVVSPGFAPYEQYQPDAGRQGPWTDIYGVGATLYAALNRGRGPLDAMARVNARIESLPDPLEPAAVIGEGRYSVRFLSAIDAALAFTPDERPRTVAEWLEMFPQPGEAADASGAPTRLATAAVPAPPTRPTRTTPWNAPVAAIGVLSLLAAGLAVTGWWSVQGDSAGTAGEEIVAVAVAANKVAPAALPANEAAPVTAESAVTVVADLPANEASPVPVAAVPATAAAPAAAAKVPVDAASGIVTPAPLPLPVGPGTGILASDGIPADVNTEGRVFLRLPHLQQETNLCVPASAAMVLSYFNDPQSPRRLKALSRGKDYSPGEPFTDFTRTWWRDLLSGMDRLGYDWWEQVFTNDAAGFRVGLDAIKTSLRLENPVLVDVALYGSHTFVIVGFDEAAKQVLISDPSLPDPGLRTLTFEQLRSIWNGVSYGLNARPALFTRRKRS